ncbi:unnamed protein product [Strongylus vulgaris]|uniref:Uncharacterized protein n=1 Tax=Strongylus vulgaris TaxID=40348 RepID=A0A3P7LMQ0_STRVU|nr:unnamed protein product [Strongylus vulgaris]
MVGLFNSTYMNVNLAITMTCMVNSTAVAIEDEAVELGDMEGNMTGWPNHAAGITDACSSAEGTRTVLDYGVSKCHSDYNFD